ncbi:MAG TPA: DoxX family protein, partial [Prolixibacteraceae bacterium]|nr:DoxX family protein [Prolixibacteraceae bacterium]
YFNAFQMPWITDLAFALGVFLAAAEFFLGIAFLFNFFIRVTSWFMLAFMVFFTGLTFVLALTNPVTDCGCFGDALVISNWETFYKNIVLTVFAIIILIYRNDMPCLVGKKPRFVLGSLVIIVYAGLVFWSYNHLPIFDFRPFKAGTNIPDAMKMPEGAPKDIYENVFYYKNKNTGEVQKFDEQNYPWQDTLNWAYENMESKLIQQGYVPPIHDFTITSAEGENVIDFFIYDKNYVFMLVAHNLEKSNRKPQDKINNLAGWAMGKGMSFICLTSTVAEEAAVFAEETGAPYEFFNCDEITLKTIIRSNPGLMLIKDGTVIKHWHYNDIPTPEEFEKEFAIEKP